MTRLILLLSLLLATQAQVQAESATWNFRVLLDGKPIGNHRFELRPNEQQHLLRSEAEFAVKLLGITVYRYRHQATEQWQGDCLHALTSSTDDDGTLSKVALQAHELPGCVMSYAYWNPRLLQQTRLVNTQTGRVDAVQVTPMGSGQIDVRGEQVTANRWRITGLTHPIDVWYAQTSATRAGRWLGLDSPMGKRVLSYRLE